MAVTATDDSCDLETSEVPAGQTTFTVTNDGESVTEVYVYGEDGGEYTRVISEVENIGPGTSRDMEVDLSSGSYEVACKPGQTGDGIRTALTVTGDGDQASGSDRASGYDRAIELATWQIIVEGDGLEDLVTELAVT